MEKLLKTNYVTKQKRKYNTNIQKAVIIPYEIFQTSNRLFMTVHPKTHVI